MIDRILSRLYDLQDARTLARTVHAQAGQIDALTTLATHLEASLEVAETAAEEYRLRLASSIVYTPGIEHSTAEIGERLYRSWEAHAAHGGAATDPPRDAATLENRTLAVCEGWRADRERDSTARLTAAEVELAATRARADEAQDRAARLQRHARALSRSARWMRKALLDGDITFTILRAMAKGSKARLARIATDRDEPPPTTRSPRAPRPTPTRRRWEEP